MVANGQHNRPGAAVNEAGLAWRARARFRWKIAGVFGGITVFGAFLLISALSSSSHLTAGCPLGGCQQIAESSQGWTAITALGTLAAGIGTLVSATASVLALRAATAARTAAAAPAKDPA